MWPYAIRVGPKSNVTAVLIRGGTSAQTHTEGRWRQRLEWCIYKPRHTGGTRSWKRQASTRGFGGSTPCQHLDFRLLDSWTESKFLLFEVTKFRVICYSSDRKLIQALRHILIILHLGRNCWWNLFCVWLVWHISFFFFNQSSVLYTSLYTCQSQSPNSAHHHPHPTAIFPPWCPYVCSLHLCVNFCPATQFICTIFLGSTYMH